MDFVNPYNIIEIPLLELLRNLAVGVIMAIILAWLVSKSTRLVVDTSQYMPLFLLLIPTMILVITIIKSSIALSLGLVGALSIVRFRTPVKEPEELAYIFIAIAIGLGLGANQLLPTIIGFLVILVVLTPSIFNKLKGTRSNSSYIDIVIETDDNNPVNMNDFVHKLDEIKLKYRLKRIMESEGRHEVTLQLAKMDMDAYEQLKTNLYRDYKSVDISMIDNARVIT
jgi:uncharacterized membrane protein YhiD involved in acid resistance